MEDVFSIGVFSLAIGMVSVLSIIFILGIFVG